MERPKISSDPHPASQDASNTLSSPSLPPSSRPDQTVDRSAPVVNPRNFFETDSSDMEREEHESDESDNSPKSQETRKKLSSSSDSSFGSRGHASRLGSLLNPNPTPRAAGPFQDTSAQYLGDPREDSGVDEPRTPIEDSETEEDQSDYAYEAGSNSITATRTNSSGATAYSPKFIKGKQASNSRPVSDEKLFHPYFSASATASPATHSPNSEAALKMSHSTNERLLSAWAITCQTILREGRESLVEQQRGRRLSEDMPRSTSPMVRPLATKRSQSARKPGILVNPDFVSSSRSLGSRSSVKARERRVQSSPPAPLTVHETIPPVPALPNNPYSVTSPLLPPPAAIRPPRQPPPPLPLNHSGQERERSRADIRKPSFILPAGYDGRKSSAVPPGASTPFPFSTPSIASPSSPKRPEHPQMKSDTENKKAGAITGRAVQIALPEPSGSFRRPTITAQEQRRRLSAAVSRSVNADTVLSLSVRRRYAPNGRITSRLFVPNDPELAWPAVSRRLSEAWGRRKSVAATAAQDAAKVQEKAVKVEEKKREDFDDAKLFFKLREAYYGELTGLSKMARLWRRYGSARVLQHISIGMPEGSSSFKEREAEEGGSGGARARRALCETGMYRDQDFQKHFWYPTIGKGRYKWVTWTHRIADDAVDEDDAWFAKRVIHSQQGTLDDQQPVTAVPGGLEFVEGWSSVRISLAVVGVVIGVILVVVLYILLGPESNDAVVATAVYPDHYLDAGQRDGARVGAGAAIGCVAALVGGLSIGAWCAVSRWLM